MNYNAAGEDVIEFYNITRTGDFTSGPFLLKAGISSTYRIAEFFGLTATRILYKTPAERDQPDAPVQRVRAPTDILHVEVLEPELEAPMGARTAPPINVGATITKALAAAGLMRR